MFGKRKDPRPTFTLQATGLDGTRYQRTYVEEPSLDLAEFDIRCEVELGYDDIVTRIDITEWSYQ